MATWLLAFGMPSQLTAQSASHTPAGFPELPPGSPRGYLDLTGLPDSLALLPPPPADGSPAFASDEAAREAAAKFKDTPRWSRAKSDADLHFPHAAETFSCAANMPITKDRMPRLYVLLGKAFIDVGLSTHRAKTHYQRMRPFAIHSTISCTPDEEEVLRKDGSYPSGHSSAGWGWALILTELFPEHTDAILRRGRDFGESRVVCDVHWQSDVDAGRIVAGATVARLHAVPAFRAALDAAKSEIEIAKAEGAMPDANLCAEEAESLHQEP